MWNRTNRHTTAATGLAGTRKTNRVPQLDNKIIVIVGGTTGLGLAAAKAFVGEGARVLVVGRNADSVSQAESALG